MKQSDHLEFVSAGTLVRPGPIGRLIRFALGVLCLYVLAAVLYYWEGTAAKPFSSLENRILVLLAPLCIFNYVVNIGFTKNWGLRPLLFSVIALVLIACVAFLVSGSVDHPVFGAPFNLWLAYFYGHLGASFVLAAILGTPGCEMRAIPELVGRATGHASEEHYCPVGFITRIDAWEQTRMSS